MRNILAIIVLAALLTGCQNSTSQRSASSATTSWNDQNGSPRPTYRQALAHADHSVALGQDRMAADDPYMEDPGPRANRRHLRRAYRQTLASAENVDGYGRGRMVSDIVTEDAADPGSWSGRGGHPRRAYRQALTDDDDGAFGERARASAPSGEADLPPSFKTVTLQHDGRQRSYLLYVPTGYRSGQPTPLVMVFHGGGGNASGIARTTNMHQLAEQYGFIAVYPNGTGARGGRRLTWNAGSSPPQGYAENNNIDDIGFVKTILQQLKQSYTIDPKRIYATGLSKGAMFTYRLGCQLSDQFAAIAPVAGSLTYAQCDPANSVAILHIHGDNDQNVPFEGGRGGFSAQMANYPSAEKGLDQLRKHNKCVAKPTQTTLTSDTDRFTYEGCENGREIAYYRVRGGGHGWPGSTPKPKHQERGVYISKQLNASAEIWKFFAAHPKP